MLSLMHQEVVPRCWIGLASNGIKRAHQLWRKSEANLVLKNLYKILSSYEELKLFGGKDKFLEVKIEHLGRTSSLPEIYYLKLFSFFFPGV